MFICMFTSFPDWIRFQYYICFIVKDAQKYFLSLVKTFSLLAARESCLIDLILCFIYISTCLFGYNFYEALVQGSKSATF